MENSWRLESHRSRDRGENMPLAWETVTEEMVLEVSLLTNLASYFPASRLRL